MVRKSLKKIITETKEIRDKIQKINFKEKFDIVVAVAKGGIVPAYLISQKAGADLEMIWLKYRDENNKVIFKEPKLLQKIAFDCKNKKILLVDDVTRSGSTLQAAKNYLKDAKLIKTFVINGKADYSLYDKKCFPFPWTLQS